jgi:hypothetical protein
MYFLVAIRNDCIELMINKVLLLDLQDLTEIETESIDNQLIHIILLIIASYRPTLLIEVQNMPGLIDVAF